MYPNSRKTANVRRLGSVDIGVLKAAVLAIPESLWQAENAAKPNRFEALDSTAHIIFRFIADFRDWRTDYSRPIWDEWRALLEPVLQAAVADYGYAEPAFPRVMLARMPVGGVIQPHRDANPAAKWPHKVHVPIQTNDGVVFRVDGQSFRIAEGEAVELNNMGIHAVENRGDTDRIHLIFEVYDTAQPAPAWVDALVATDAKAVG